MTDAKLLPCGDEDYKLNDEYTSVWVTVDNISVYIQRTDEGVAVELWPLGFEDCDLSVAGALLTFDEAEGKINENNAKRIGA